MMVSRGWLLTTRTLLEILKSKVRGVIGPIWSGDIVARGSIQGPAYTTIVLFGMNYWPPCRPSLTDNSIVVFMRNSGFYFVEI